MPQEPLRPHQAQAIRRTCRAITTEHFDKRVTNSNFLLQHAAGSGKSKTAAALAKELLLLRDSSTKHRLFLFAFIVVDRVHLTQQLYQTASQYLADVGAPSSWVALSSCVDQLQAYMGMQADNVRRPRIIVTTVQSFWSMWMRVRRTSTLSDLQAKLRANHQRIAIICDEVHRSHSWKSIDIINHLLSSNRGHDVGGTKDGAGNRRQRHNSSSRSSKDNSSRVHYIGLTATPSENALRLFGVKEVIKTPVQSQRPSAIEPQTQHQQQQQQQFTVQGHTFRPFHVYTLRQALDDGLVLDVLCNYRCKEVKVLLEGCDGSLCKQEGRQLQQQEQQQQQQQQPWQPAGVQGSDLDGHANAMRRLSSAALKAVSSSPQVAHAKAEVMAEEIAATMRSAYRAAYSIAVGEGQPQQAAEAGVFPDARMMVVTQSRLMVVAYTYFLRAFLHDLMGSQAPTVWGAFTGSVTAEEMRPMWQYAARYTTQATKHKEAEGPSQASQQQQQQQQNQQQRQQQNQQNQQQQQQNQQNQQHQHQQDHLQQHRRCHQNQQQQQPQTVHSNQHLLRDLTEGQHHPQQQQQAEAGTSGECHVGSKLDGGDQVGGLDSSRNCMGRQVMETQQPNSQRQLGKEARLPYSQQQRGEEMPRFDQENLHKEQRQQHQHTQHQQHIEANQRLQECCQEPQSPTMPCSLPHELSPETDCSRQVRMLRCTSPPGVSNTEAAAAAPAAAAAAESNQQSIACSGSNQIEGAGRRGHKARCLERGLREGGLPRPSKVQRLDAAMVGRSYGQQHQHQHQHQHQNQQKQQQQQQQQQQRQRQQRQLLDRNLLLRAGFQRAVPGARKGAADVPTPTQQPPPRACGPKPAVQQRVCIFERLLSSKKDFNEKDLNANIQRLEDARILVVCKKHETGYNDPRLCKMFVDRQLQGSKAVQVLCRLNRPCPGKTPACISVMDFANSANDICSAFEDHLGVITHSAGSHVAKEEAELQRLANCILESLDFAVDNAATDPHAQEGAPVQQVVSPSSLTIPQFAQLMTSSLPVERYMRLRHAAVNYVALGEALGRELPQLPLVYFQALLLYMAEAQKAVEWSLPEPNPAHPLQPHCARSSDNRVAGARAASGWGQMSQKGESDEDGEECDGNEDAVGLRGQKGREGEEERAEGRGGGGGGVDVQAPGIESCQLQETYNGPITLSPSGGSSRTRLLPLGVSGMEAAQKLLQGSTSLADAIRASYRVCKQREASSNSKQQACKDQELQQQQQQQQQRNHEQHRGLSRQPQIPVHKHHPKGCLVREGAPHQPHQSSHQPATCTPAGHAATLFKGAGSDGIEDPASALATSTATTTVHRTLQAAQPSPSSFAAAPVAETQGNPGAGQPSSSASSPPLAAAPAAASMKLAEGGMHAMPPAQTQAGNVRKAVAARRPKDGFSGMCTMSSVLPIHAVVSERIEDNQASDTSEQAVHSQLQGPMEQPQHALPEVQAREALRLELRDAQLLEQRPQQTLHEPGIVPSSSKLRDQRPQPLSLELPGQSPQQTLHEPGVAPSSSEPLRRLSCATEDEGAGTSGSQEVGLDMSGTPSAGTDTQGGEEEELYDPDLEDIMRALHSAYLEGHVCELLNALRGLLVWPVSRASLEATTVAAESGRPEPVWRFMHRVLLQHSSQKVVSLTRQVLSSWQPLLEGMLGIPLDLWATHDRVPTTTSFTLPAGATAATAAEAAGAAAAAATAACRKEGSQPTKMALQQEQQDIQLQHSKRKRGEGSQGSTPERMHCGPECQEMGASQLQAPPLPMIQQQQQQQQQKQQEHEAEVGDESSRGCQGGQMSGALEDKSQELALADGRSGRGRVRKAGDKEHSSREHSRSRGADRGQCGRRVAGDALDAQRDACRGQHFHTSKEAGGAGMLPLTPNSGSRQTSKVLEVDCAQGPPFDALNTQKGMASQVQTQRGDSKTCFVPPQAVTELPNMALPSAPPDVVTAPKVEQALGGRESPNMRRLSQVVDELDGRMAAAVRQGKLARAECDRALAAGQKSDMRLGSAAGCGDVGNNAACRVLQKGLSEEVAGAAPLLMARKLQSLEADAKNEGRAWRAVREAESGWMRVKQTRKLTQEEAGLGGADGPASDEEEGIKDGVCDEQVAETMSQAVKDRTRQDAEDFKSLEGPSPPQEQPASPKASARKLDKLRDGTRRGKEALLDTYERQKQQFLDIQQQLAATQQQLAATQQQLAEADSRSNHLAADYGVFKAKTSSTLAAKTAHLTTLSDSLHRLQEQGPAMQPLRDFQQQLVETTCSIKQERAALHTSLAVAGVPSEEPEEDGEAPAEPVTQPAGNPSTSYAAAVKPPGKKQVPPAPQQHQQQGKQASRPKGQYSQGHVRGPGAKRQRIVTLSYDDLKKIVAESK